MAAKSTTGAEIPRVYEPADSYGYWALADRLRAPNKVTGWSGGASR
jgi:hypothetical protein